MGYTVVRTLARGGMGVVELATDDATGALVARKRVPLHGQAASIDHARQRIRREAEVLGSLDHPAIVPLLAVEDDGDDIVLVMPYLAGGTLAERVQRDGPLPAGDVAALAAALTPALAAAHRQGIVHRDIKPENVLFDDAGRPALADFGVAFDRQATPGLTAAGLVVGTPRFMAPEQARSQGASAASDVFSLGATLLFAATGTGPWGDGPAAVLMGRATRGRVVGLRALPPGLRALLAPLLDRDPGRRPTAAALAGGPDGTEVRTLLTRALPRRRRSSLAAGTGAALGVGPGGRVRARHGQARRRRLTAAGAALALLGAAGVAALLPDDRGPGGDRGRDGRTATTACTPRPYQPCGSPPAPNTDGQACLARFADFDDIATNGCEAEADDVDGQDLVDGRAIVANLVPEGDVDIYVLEVEDRFQLACDGELRVTLTAPPGGAQRLELLRGETVVARAASADGQPDTAVLGDPECGQDDRTTLHARVSTVGAGRTAASYRLTRAGSF